MQGRDAALPAAYPGDAALDSGRPSVSVDAERSLAIVSLATESQSQDIPVTPPIVAADDLS